MSFRGIHRKFFYIRENEAFTEDDVLIHNLFVFGIPPGTSSGDLQYYFSKFGELSRVCLAAAQNYSVKQIGFVNFVNAKDAARVLKMRHHYLGSKRIGVTACYSWQQPDAIKSNKPLASASAASNSAKEPKEQSEKKEEEDNESEEQQENDSDGEKAEGSSLNILQLNDDVLEHVCSFLHISDQIAFSRTCKRFQDVFMMHSKWKYKDFNMTTLHELTLWETRDFLQLCGSYIQALHGAIPSKGRNRIAEFCGLHCVNVKTLRLSSFNFKPTLLKKFLNKMTAVTEVDMVGTSMNDNSIYLLSKLEHLKVLRTTSNINITGKYFSLLKELEELCLKSCVSIKEEYFVDFMKELKNLRVLDVQQFELRHGAIRAIVQHGRNIEILKMTAPEALPYADIATLPKLTHLEIINDSTFNSNLFGKLAEHKSDQLEILMYTSKFSFTEQHVKNIAKLQKLKVLSCAIRYITNSVMITDLTKLKELTALRLKGPFFIEQHLLEILKKCHKLKHLNISRCTQITGNFIHEAVKILEDLNKRHLRNYPLRLAVYDSSIKTSIKWAPDLKNKEHILQLYLHVPFHENEHYTKSDDKCIYFHEDFLSEDEYSADLDDDLDDDIYFDSSDDDLDSVFNQRQLFHFYMDDMMRALTDRDNDTTDDFDYSDFF